MSWFQQLTIRNDCGIIFFLFHSEKTKTNEITLQLITLLRYWKYKTRKLPDALHSSVTVLPFLAATCPLVGIALNVGGTKNNRR